MTPRQRELRRRSRRPTVPELRARVANLALAITDILDAPATSQTWRRRRAKVLLAIERAESELLGLRSGIENRARGAR